MRGLGFSTQGSAGVRASACSVLHFRHEFYITLVQEFYKGIGKIFLGGQSSSSRNE